MSQHSGKRLSDLKLTDLKLELEKRNMDTSGNKATLKSRLEDALVANGHNSEDFVFKPDDTLQTGQAGSIVQAPGDLLVHDDDELDFSSEGPRNVNPEEPLSPAQQTALITEANDVTKKVEDNETEQCAEVTTNQLNENGSEEDANREQDMEKCPIFTQDSEEAKSSSRNLWISNLDASIKASDLTSLVSSYGTTDGAKVIVSNRDQDSPFGFVTMSSIEAADECVKKLDNSEWNGKVIKVEKISRDPTLPPPSQNGESHISISPCKSRGSLKDESKSPSAYDRVSASDRRRLGLKSDEKAYPNSNDGKEDSRERGIEYYRRRARRDFDTIRELQGTIERNRRRHAFQLQRERERASRIEAQSRSALRRERELLTSERDLLDKRRSDLDRLERLLKDRERQMDEKERAVNDYGRSRHPGGMSSSGYGQQTTGRYFSNPPSSASKRPYDPNASWDQGGKRMNSRPDFNSSQSYRTGGSSVGRGGRHDDRSGYNNSDRTSSYEDLSKNPRRWERSAPAMSSATSGSSHWQKSLKPPYSSGNDYESAGGESWSRPMHTTNTRRY